MTISLMKLMMKHHLENLVVCLVVRRKETVCLMNQKRYVTRMEYSYLCDMEEQEKGVFCTS